MKAPTIRVVKLGGSLLGLGQLPERIDTWLCDQPPAKTVIIVGGGPAVEMIRRWAARRQWPDRRSHWTAIRAMGNNTRRLAGHWQLVADLEEARQAGPSPVLLDVEVALRAMEKNRQDPLPWSWDVTSDSIAARIARELGSGELVLLKSTSPSSGDPQSLAREGIVDCYFPRAANSLETRVVNLRHVSPRPGGECRGKTVGPSSTRNWSAGQDGHP
ncbi:MAG: hypothetical protein QGH11_03645 [Pirellulaceae bacterium]|nr:hypothetical protein [Pirellulaceae bacterium]